MRKYRFRQEIGITTESGYPIKEFTVQMYMNAENIDEGDIMKMFAMYADNFAGLIDEESEKVISMDEDEERGGVVR